jgi:glycosyltransferase involved in cell wall biosynthesis
MKSGKPPLQIYNLKFPERSRWFPGDQIPRRLVRALVNPLRLRPTSGLGKVTQNLTLGLDRLGIPYDLRTDVDGSNGDSAAGILHGPVAKARQIAETRPCIIGPGVMTTPNDWPGVLEETRTAFLVQACDWSAEMYRAVFGDRVRVWPVGIDTDRFAPHPTDSKSRDFLIYDKIRWAGTPYDGLVERAKEELTRRNLSYHYIRYGQYEEPLFERLLRDSRAMLFLCEHESQGIAYNEALGMDVPILASNYGVWCDPNQRDSKYGDIRVTTVPYWDDRCGLDFRSESEFAGRLDEFSELVRARRFAPRQYILENLTLEQRARQYADLCEEAREVSKSRVR